MQIRIEIDLKPEELRRFLGLPDVAGLQEDVIQFLREKVGSASENFDPANFVKENFESLRKSAAWRKIMEAAKMARPADQVAETSTPARKTRRRRASATAKNS